MVLEPFDWPAFLKLAEELALRPQESCRRTAISRAYYFIYHLARQRVEANGFVLVAGGDSHKQVWEKYSASPDFQCKKLGELARHIKLRRQRADYEPHFARVEEETGMILIMARDFAERLKRLPARLPANAAPRN